MKNRSKESGVVLVEAIVVASILLIVATGLIFANIAYITSASFTLSSTKATFLAQEGVEVVKYIRTSGWEDGIENLTDGTTYYLSFSPTAWATTTTQEIVDGKFYRSFVVEEVLRDVNDDIASSGTADSNTKKLTVDVSWLGKTGTTTRTIQTYITNFLE